MAVVLKNKKTKLENLGFAHFCGGGGVQKGLNQETTVFHNEKKNPYN